jgi:N6-adenosine-specific RNA methylase IME4
MDRSGQYQCLLIDPPWPQRLAGKYQKNQRPGTMPYPTMTVADIAALPVASLAANGAHLWLWTTNQFIEDGFRLISQWGFTYLAPIHAIKPSGFGNYFSHRTQTLLFAYKDRCYFPQARYLPNIIHVGNPRRHSEKWQETFEYIESVSPGPRLELFARAKRDGWHAWGNEVESDLPPDWAAAS